MTIINDLAAAFTLLTRLPVGILVVPAASPARAAWCFPIVGAVVGLLAAVVLAAAHGTRLPPLLAATWTLATFLLLTGAIHEDGLADTADALGGATPVARLAIMRDSRIGTFGALALIAAVLIRVAGIAALSPGLAAASLVVTGAVSRAGMLIPILLLPSARPGGLADPFASAGRSAPVIGLLIAIGLSCVVLPMRPALLVLLATACAGLAISAAAMRQVGGYTGDVLGATEQIVECVALTVLAAA